MSESGWYPDPDGQKRQERRWDAHAGVWTDNTRKAAGQGFGWFLWLCLAVTIAGGGFWIVTAVNHKDSSGSTSAPAASSSCDFDCGDGATDPGYTQITSYTYSIDGDAATSSTVTYTDSDGTIQQETDASLPWEQTVDAGGDFYSISAQDGEGGSSISCTITDDQGNVITTHTAHGLYAIVECQT